MYGDQPYAREIRHVGKAAGVATSSEFIEGHDVPPDVLTGVVDWLLMGNDTECEVMGQMKDFEVCPLCKTAWYCGDACPKRG
jgi:hypothetical protein